MKDPKEFESSNGLLRRLNLVSVDEARAEFYNLLREIRSLKRERVQLEKRVKEAGEEVTRGVLWQAEMAEKTTERKNERLNLVSSRVDEMLNRGGEYNVEN